MIFERLEDRSLLAHLVLDSGSGIASLEINFNDGTTFVSGPTIGTGGAVTHSFLGNESNVANYLDFNNGSGNVLAESVALAGYPGVQFASVLAECRAEFTIAADGAEQDGDPILVHVELSGFEPNSPYNVGPTLNNTTLTYLVSGAVVGNSICRIGDLISVFAQTTAKASPDSNDNYYTARACHITVTLPPGPQNQPPVITGIAPNSPSIREGQSVTISGTFTDPDAGDTHTATVTWDDGVVSPAAVDEVMKTFTATRQFDDNGTHVAKAEVIDSFGASDEDSTMVTVNNVAPTATLSFSGGMVTFTNQIDPSAADTAAGFHYSYQFDNGVSFSGISSDSVPMPTALLQPNIQTFTVVGTITDKDGGATSYTKTFVNPNYSPPSPVVEQATAVLDHILEKNEQFQNDKFVDVLKSLSDSFSNNSKDNGAFSPTFVFKHKF